jgi:hypothetical protein
LAPIVPQTLICGSVFAAGRRTTGTVQVEGGIWQSVKTTKAAMAAFIWLSSVQTKLISFSLLDLAGQ